MEGISVLQSFDEEGLKKSCNAVDSQNADPQTKKDKLRIKIANVAPSKRDAEPKQAAPEISPAKTRSGKTITRTGEHLSCRPHGGLDALYGSPPNFVKTIRKYAHEKH